MAFFLLSFFFLPFFLHFIRFVRPGRLYAILGDNGAGKTTLLRVLAGLAQPTRGSVSVLGTKELRSVCHELGYMAHPSLLYDEMSGAENLRYFGRLYGIAIRLLPT